MAELFLESWWPISLSVAVAIIMAVTHRVCANIAFETSYRKGFFTRGTDFGVFFGVPGVLFVGSWRQIEAPNSTNQQQLMMTPDDGRERWDSGLAQLTLGIGVLVYQLMAVVILRNPAISSHWFWLAALGLIVTGWASSRGGCPGFHMMPPVELDGSEDHPELVRFFAQRYEWGRLIERMDVVGRLGLAAFWMAIVFVVAAVVVWGFKLPFANWIACVACLVLSVAAGVAFFYCRRVHEDLDYDALQLVLNSAPSPRHRQLMKMQIDFMEQLESLSDAETRAASYSAPPATTGLFTLIFGVLSGNVLLIIVGSIAFIAAGALAGITVQQSYSDWESVEEFMHELREKQAEIESRQAEIAELAEELEQEDIAAALREARADIPEFYSFQMGEIIGRGVIIPEGLRQRVKRSQLDAEMRDMLDRDQWERETGYMTWASREAEYLSRLRTGRVRAFWGGCIILLLMVIFDIYSFPAIVWTVLKYTALACFVLAVTSYLPEKFLDLRDPGCLGGIGKVVSIAVVIIMIWALFNVPS